MIATFSGFTGNKYVKPKALFISSSVRVFLLSQLSLRSRATLACERFVSDHVPVMTAISFADLSPARPLTEFGESWSSEYPAVTALVTTELRSQTLRAMEILDEAEVGKGLGALSNYRIKKTVMLKIFLQIF